MQFAEVLPLPITVTYSTNLMGGTDFAITYGDVPFKLITLDNVILDSGPGSKGWDDVKWEILGLLQEQIDEALRVVA